MKRYELAKKEGLPWEAVLVTDAETDIKLLVRDCVVNGDSLYEVNNKVTSFIGDLLNNIESPAIKDKVRQSFPLFATRLYYQWLAVIGTQALAYSFLTALKAQKTDIPKEVEEKLKSLPKTQNLSSFTASFGNAYNRATPNAVYNLEYEKEVKKRIENIAGMTAKVDYNSRYSLRASVEIELRNERNQKQIEDLRNDGVQLAWINTHVNCSERCQPWQGKLYSLDGTYGKIDGISYQPLENATEIYDKYGYKNGCLSGFNCRHRLVKYSKGFKPIAIPAKEIKWQRHLEQQQRYMERTVRKYESLALINKANKETKEYRHYKSMAKSWADKYEKFSKRNKIPFYPSRLDI